MVASTFYANNTMIAVLDQLKDHQGNPVTTATVTLENMLDSAGVLVTGVTFPVTMNHVGNARYEGFIPETAAVVVGRNYLSTIKAVDGTTVGSWVESLPVRTRTG